MRKSILLILAVALSLSLSAQNVFVRDQKIVVEMVGQETVLAPNGPDESYFWVSLSPDRKHIAYSTAHHGTFTCDLNGKNVHFIGVMGSPTWMDNEMVAGMYEYRDEADEMHMRYLTVSRDGKMQRELTEHEADWLVKHENDRLEQVRQRNYARISAKRAVMAAKAKTAGLAGIKIYLNPGHGGYDGNDRSCWTIPVPELWTNPEGYWESKSNLVKGLFLRDMLEGAGATVIISRTQNRSGWRDINESHYYNYAVGTPEYNELIAGDDRQLSAIAEEANANEVDHFLSIHSNAQNERTNYLLMLFRGYGGPGVAYSAITPPSYEMATMAGNIQIKNQLTVWGSGSTPLIRGDISFYDPSWNGLGVLRPLTVPGHLSEGSFHDYAPETHRLMNDDYCKLEALRMFQYFHKWFDRELPQTACISGWVKSSNQTIEVLGDLIKNAKGETEYYYFPNTDDQWLPLNEATVKLCDANGNVLQTKVTDNWYNGIFAFYDLTPGKYIVTVEKGGYVGKSETVTVAAEDIAQLKFKIPYTRIEAPDFEEPEQDQGTQLLPEYKFVKEGGEKALGEAFKRVVYRNGKVYALADDGTLTERDLAMKILRTIPVPAGVTFSDITFASDNFLLAGVAAENKWKIYVYDADLTEATLMLDRTVSGSVTGTLAASAPHWKAALWTTTATSVLSLNFDEDHPNEGEVKVISTSGLNANSRLTLKPGKKVDAANDNMIPCFVRYANKSIMVKPEVQNGKVGFRLWDVTSSHKAISAFYAMSGSATRAHAFAYVDKYVIHAYIVADGLGVQHFVTNIAEIPNIFASELNFRDGKFSFRLNTDATSATLRIEKNGELISSTELGALAMGAHEIDNPFATTGFDAYELTVSAEPVSYPALVSDNDRLFCFATPIGVAVDRTPNSPYFGRIYVTDAEGGDANGRTTTKGVYVLSADYTDITAQGNTAYDGAVTWGEHNPGKNYQMAIARPAVAPDGEVFIPSATAKSSGVYVMDPSDPGKAFVPVFDGKRNSVSGKIKNRTTSDVVANPVMHCVITGYGAEKTLYTMDHDISSTTLSSSLNQYNIGGGELPWTDKPSAIVYDDAQYGKMQNGSGQIARDNRGGWWLSQYRYASTEAIPSLIHVTNGQIDFNFGTAIATSQQGGMAVSRNGNLLAIGREPGTVAVYSVTYAANGKPTLTERSVIKYSESECMTLGCDFDAAGNLYVVSPTNHRLMIFTMPKLNNSFTTRRSANLKEDETFSAVDQVSSDGKVTRKLIRDGQLLIDNGRAQYNAQGIKL